MSTASQDDPSVTAGATAGSGDGSDQCEEPFRYPPFVPRDAIELAAREMYKFTPIPGEPGIRIKELENHYVDVIPMIFNWRVVRRLKDIDIYDRAWCFYGTTTASFVAACLGAYAWDGTDDTAPAGWDKNVMTGEYSREVR